SAISLLPLAQPLRAGATLHLALPPASGKVRVETLLDARAADGTGFRVERVAAPNGMRLRLVAVDRDGAEHASAWSAAIGVGSVVLGLDENGAAVVLETPDAELTLPLSGDAAQNYDARAAAGSD